MSSLLRSSALVLVLAPLFPTFAQTAAAPVSATQNDQMMALEKKLERLEGELNEVKGELNALKAQGAAPATVAPAAVAAPASAAAAPAAASVTTAAAKPEAPAYTALPGGATLNFTVDGYYEYNLNHPPGRANDLRAYDVLGDVFSLNQASVIFELPTDADNGRRFGARIDLQFGQATATLQGNPTNENRPDVYRNIFQAYGRYVAPLNKGLTIDFGKWASSLGYEGNYTKDQLNYSRSFFFYFLPFYHMGARVNYQVTDKFAANYWIVNGTNQTEPNNSYKDELFGINLTPSSKLNWTINYYLGQEHPDSTPATNCTVPLQPGLCFTPLVNPPNGKTNILDSYASWQATRRLLLAGEADYEIVRLYANAGPGQSSAPAHVTGGVAYAGFQATTRSNLAARAEYLSDREGLFSGTSQALKETTATYSFRFGDGFETFLEYRRDWSNREYFPRGNAGVLVDHQDTAALGLVWWYGAKQGSW